MLLMWHAKSNVRVPPQYVVGAVATVSLSMNLCVRISYPTYRYFLPPANDIGMTFVDIEADTVWMEEWWVGGGSNHVKYNNQLLHCHDTPRRFVAFDSCVWKTESHQRSLARLPSRPLGKWNTICTYFWRWDVCDSWQMYTTKVRCCPPT